jgi:NTE family protein
VTCRPLAVTTDETMLHSASPFRDSGPAGVRLRDHLAAIVDGGFHIDPARKQIAGERAVWTLLMRDRPAGHVRSVEVGFQDGRVTELRLGPAAANR